MDEIQILREQLANKDNFGNIEVKIDENTDVQNNTYQLQIIQLKKELEEIRADDPTGSYKQKFEFLKKTNDQLLIDIEAIKVENGRLKVLK